MHRGLLGLMVLVTTLILCQTSLGTFYNEYNDTHSVVHKLAQDILKLQRQQQQDTDVFMRFAHVQQLLQTIDILRQMASDRVVGTIARVNIVELRNRALKVQSNLHTFLSSRCRVEGVDGRVI